jgi:hypothetical protein
MLTAVIWLSGLIFSAGISLATFRVIQSQTSKDINGLGLRSRSDGKKNDARFFAVSLILIQTVPEKDRATVTALLNAANE